MKLVFPPSASMTVYFLYISGVIDIQTGSADADAPGTVVIAPGASSGRVDAVKKLVQPLRA